MKRSHPAPSTGFTLLEVLIAVAVLGILFALTYSQGGAMVEKSKEVRCVNNMRQFSPALAAFIGDNNGRLPTGIKNKVPGMKARLGYDVSWGIALLPYLVSTHLAFTDAELERYAEFFRCPSDKWFVASGDGAWSYGWNQACGNGMDPTTPPYPSKPTRITQFPQPGLIPVIGEAHHHPTSAYRNFSFFYSDTSTLTLPANQPQMSAMRHPAFKINPPPAKGDVGPPRRHLLFLDGHVAKSHAPYTLLNQDDLFKNGLME